MYGVKEFVCLSVNLYLSIWIDSKPIVWDFSLIKYVDYGLATLLEGAGYSFFSSAMKNHHFALAYSLGKLGYC